MDILTSMIPILGIGVALLALLGWILTTWIRVKHGYPLDGFGKALHPHTDKDSVERIKLLTSENAQLRAEMGSFKDRLETMERIVTDQPARLAREIDSLAVDTRGNA
ncbi:MAG TPA: hypothetical protein VK485_00835 [Sphingomicrobium sp.]|nr:hypothetical protein [Sphingomicrobium sp.]